MLIYTITAEDYFYPRSPCGERRCEMISIERCSFISIHALLAESDNWLRTAGVEDDISIHALLAESDVVDALELTNAMLFLSTLSLRRATGYAINFHTKSRFLSTLSLRRATL